MEVVKPFNRKVAAFIGTHDMPMFTAIWNEKQAGILLEAGLIPENELAAETLRVQSHKKIFETLIGDEESGTGSRHAFKQLSRKLREREPSIYFTLLDDLIGEEMPINIPGTIDEYPNWRRKYAISIDDLVL